MSVRPISSIDIGDRHRKHLGDLSSLAESIQAVGLLHPVVVTPDGRLIAGERRLAAFRDILCRREIPVHVVDIEALARGEHAENVERKDFTPSEAVAVWEAVGEEEKRLAKGRQAHGQTAPGRNASGKLPQASKSRDKAAHGTGRGARTLEKAAAIVKAVESEPDNPILQKIHADMDRTGRVDGPFKRLKVAKQAERIRKEPPPLPSQGPYRVIVADPPWPYELRKADPSHRATHPYPQMSMDEIRAMDVRSLAHDDCILWLWTTNHHMREAFTVLDSWGFAQKTILTWVKDRMGTGDWLRGQTEHCLMAVRGKPTVTLSNQTTALHGPLRENSRKPDEFYAFVESLCPAPRYALLFHRGLALPNWDGHGDEAAHAAE